MIPERHIIENRYCKTGSSTLLCIKKQKLCIKKQNGYRRMLSISRNFEFVGMLQAQFALN